ncbi:MAG: DoxX family protein [Candidatus Acidiferrales bacterium]
MTDYSLNRSAAWGIALLRVIVGIVFVAHGAQKLFGFGLAGLAGFLGQQGIPLPTVAAAVLIATELGGGLALVLGLLTRWAALPLAFAMLVATLTVHLEGGFFLPQGYEYTLTLLAATIALALTGPGRPALDALLAQRPD